ncbi:phosphatidylinositol-glycan biosynthesis class W protein-like isoform X2 [Physella acuta]|uniref:phosphatidylinositol-glycan biosynthesis class W protein-like isoform X2 n=1 Tax=Physella acuta TaxID=109671 RepID=UPI0027DE4F3E|nr:phosphatidylinositol-glycan biosynthesis class W protein-like isoform X2 [Physella acuta]
MSSYKLEHEVFVSGHNGTSYTEVAATTAISCIACFTRDLFLLSSASKTWLRLKSVINICTAVAILAVDFPVFPRRLAKTEIYGFGGMDIGVGLYVVANAIVSPEAKQKPGSSAPVLSQMGKSIISSIPLIVLAFARLIAVKGADYHEHVTEYGVHWNFFFTIVALKILLTLMYCIIPIQLSTYFAAAILLVHQLFLSRGNSDYIVNGLNGRGGREGLVDANREGIYSLPGYIVIYMLGVGLGKLLFQKRNNLKDWLDAAKQIAVLFLLFLTCLLLTHQVVEPASRRFANAAFVFWVMNLSCLMILLCLLGEIATTYIKALQKQNTSKQLGKSLLKNSSDQAISKKDQQRSQNDPPLFNVCMMEAVAFNSLLYFLLANLMTGVVNMTISTLHTSDISAVAILVVYMFALSGIIVFFKSKNISTKIW